MRILVLKVWWGADHGETPAGFTKATEDTLNSLRIGKLGIVFGVDDS